MCVGVWSCVGASGVRIGVQCMIFACVYVHACGACVGVQCMFLCMRGAYVNMRAACQQGRGRVCRACGVFVGTHACFYACVVHVYTRAACV